MARTYRIALIPILAFLCFQANLSAQPPRGMGSFGGGPPDPDMIFNFMSKGKDSVNRADLDERMQRMFDRTAEKAGVTNGILTREQFKKTFEESRKEMEKNGGVMRFGGGSSPGGDRGGPGADRGGRDGGRGGDDKSDRFAEYYFKSRDKNGDGLLSFDEMTDQLQADRDKYDTNKDGFIDLNEYKVVIKDRMAQDEKAKSDAGKGTSPAPSSDASKDNKSNVVIQQETAPVPEPERKRPVLMRAGKLPKELPSWFERLDEDHDGQVAMYEWNKDGKSLPEFTEYDMNGDGFITPEECLRVTKMSPEEKTKYLASRRESESEEASVSNDRPSIGIVSTRSAEGTSMYGKNRDDKNKDEKKEMRKFGGGGPQFGGSNKPDRFGPKK
jgi:Ca2+-binding EF-hand superfamily protein